MIYNAANLNYKSAVWDSNLKRRFTVKRQRLLQQRIDEAIGQYTMLSHPFYQLWSDGKLSRETLSEYSKQYYAHVFAFPTYVSAVHSRCDSLPVRQLLLENLIEEERGPDNHPELWLRFAEGLGVDREQVRTAELLPSTKRSVENLKTLTSSIDYRLGVASLYAYESQIPEVAKTKRSGLKEFYGVDDTRAVSFFTVHESADQVHRQIEMKILRDACDNEETADEIVAAAQKGAKCLWDFLDGVREAYVS
jgi:pyrroloquinoline-quinone synthase